MATNTKRRNNNSTAYYNPFADSDSFKSIDRAITTDKPTNTGAVIGSDDNFLDDAKKPTIKIDPLADVSGFNEFSISAINISNIKNEQESLLDISDNESRLSRRTEATPVILNSLVSTLVHSDVYLAHGLAGGYLAWQAMADKGKGVPKEGEGGFGKDVDLVGYWVAVGILWMAVYCWSSGACERMNEFGTRLTKNNVFSKKRAYNFSKALLSVLVNLIAFSALPIFLSSSLTPLIIGSGVQKVPSSSKMVTGSIALKESSGGSVNMTAARAASFALWCYPAAALSALNACFKVYLQRDKELLSKYAISNILLFLLILTPAVLFFPTLLPNIDQSLGIALFLYEALLLIAGGSIYAGDPDKRTYPEDNYYEYFIRALLNGLSIMAAVLPVFVALVGCWNYLGKEVGQATFGVVLVAMIVLYGIGRGFVVYHQQFFTDFLSEKSFGGIVDFNLKVYLMNWVIGVVFSVAFIALAFSFVFNGAEMGVLAKSLQSNFWVALTCGLLFGHNALLGATLRVARKMTVIVVFMILDAVVGCVIYGLISSKTVELGGVLGILAGLGLAKVVIGLLSLILPNWEKLVY